MTALKNIPTLIGGAAILAAAAIGLTAGTASAVYDNEGYWNCVVDAKPKHDCCIMNDGEFDEPTGTCGEPAKMTQVPGTPGLPGQVGNATPPTAATNAPVTSAPGSRAPGRLPSGGVAAP